MCERGPGRCVKTRELATFYLYGLCTFIFLHSRRWVSCMCVKTPVGLGAYTFWPSDRLGGQCSTIVCVNERGRVGGSKHALMSVNRPHQRPGWGRFAFCLYALQKNTQANFYCSRVPPPPPHLISFLLHTSLLPHPLIGSLQSQPTTRDKMLQLCDKIYIKTTKLCS